MNIEVLDCGHVQYISHMGSDLTVCQAARVSFDKETEWEDTNASGGILTEKDEKLIKYLAKHNHWTPFAHPQITLRIKTPIAIRAQLGKHQVGLVMNEVSRRYISSEPEFYSPRWRTKTTNGAKQGSEDFMDYGDGWNYCNIAYSRAIESCMETYDLLLSKGVAPEQARFVLPQGAYTEFWWTGSLMSFARVCKLRTDTHAQWEIQRYADAISQIIRPLFPVSWEHLVS